jgi:hypothetical protein
VKETELYELLDAYLAGELDEAGRTWLQVELAAAGPDLLASLADQLAMDRALRVHMGADAGEKDRQLVDSVIAHLCLSPAEDFRARLLERISRGRTASPPRLPAVTEDGRDAEPRRSPPWPIAVVSAAACLLILFGAQWLARRPDVRPAPPAADVVATPVAAAPADPWEDEINPARLPERLREAERLRREYVRRWYGDRTPMETREPGPAAAPARAPQPAPAPAVPAVAAVPRTGDPPAVPPPDRKDPDATPSPAAPGLGRESAVVEARVDRVQGDVFILADEGQTPGATGQPLLSGQGVQTGGGESRAAVRYADGTRLELGAGSTISLIGTRRDEESAGIAVGGRGIFVVEGELTADVARQPAGQPVIIATPHAEVKILGTRVLLSVSPRATQVEVREGRVRVVRRQDGVSADVAAGQFVVAMDGVPLAAKPVLSAEGLRLWFKLDEGCGLVAIDSSGNGHHGLLKGGPRWVEGRSGTALDLDVHDSIRVRGTPALRPAAQVAVSLWLRPGAFLTGSADVFSMGDSYALRVSRDGNATFFAWNGSDWINAGTSGTRLTDGGWHHVVGQKTATGLEMYVDGVLKGSIPMVSPIAYSLGANLFVGKHGDRKTDFFFKGSVDDVRVYSRALSEKEIQTLAGQRN